MHAVVPWTDSAMEEGSRFNCPKSVITLRPSTCPRPPCNLLGPTWRETAFKISSASRPMSSTFCGNAQVSGDRYDTIVLDPPAFAKNKESLAGALRGYKEINNRAMRLLKDGGILVTCSCSHPVSEGLFAEMLAEAANDAGCWLRVLERRIQASDHPVLMTVPETLYLKCFILEIRY